MFSVSSSNLLGGPISCFSLSQIMFNHILMSWSFKATKEKKSVRGFGFCFLFFFLRKKNNLKIMSVRKAPPGILQGPALTWLLPQLMFKPKCLNRSRIPSPCQNQYERLYTTPPPKTSWVFLKRFYNSKQSLATFGEGNTGQWQARKKGRQNKAGRFKKICKQNVNA